MARRRRTEPEQEQLIPGAIDPAIAEVKPDFEEQPAEAEEQSADVVDQELEADEHEEADEDDEVPDFGEGHGGQLRLAFYQRAQEFLVRLVQGQQELDTTAVHRLRVASRRLDSTLNLLSSLLGKGPVKKVRVQVKEIRSLLGTLRDLHRQLEWLAEEPLLDELLTDRASELPSLVSKAGKKLRRYKVRKLEKKLELIDALLAALLEEENAEESVREILSRHVWENLLIAMAQSEQVDPDHSFSYHPLRIALKHFRYQAEVYTASGWSSRLDENEGWDRLRELHHALGDLQDLEVLSCHLDLYWAETPPVRETQARIFNRLMKERNQVLSRVHLQDLDWESFWAWPSGDTDEELEPESESESEEG